MTRLEAIVHSLVREVAELRADMRELRLRVDRNFLWTIGIMLGIMIPMWVSVIAAIVLRT